MTNFPCVSAYVHFPFCRRRCYYCDFPIAVLGNKTDIHASTAIKDYVNALCREIILTPPLESPLETVFFGGGTPSLIPVKDLETILMTLDRTFGINSDAEISMEIDPGTFTLDQLRGYRQAGVNRVSLGVQAFQSELLQACGRSHDVKDIFNAFDWITQVGVPHLSLDLISGLPHQTLNQWEFSLAQALSLSPDHLSCYDLVLEPVTAFGKQYHPGDAPLPTDDTTAQMYRLAQRTLTQAGYTHYEISNYAKQEHQCRHNRVYWENRPYYGFGMGAASYTNDKRFTRPRTRQSYYTWIEQFAQDPTMKTVPVVAKGDRLLETLMLGLRLAEGVLLSSLIAEYGKSVLSPLWQSLQPYYRQGWVKFVDSQDNLLNITTQSAFHPVERIQLSDPEGFLFSNTVLATLFEKMADFP